MNKELIKKYKKEFDHFLNGGKLLCSLKDDLKWINATEATWNFKDEENIVIIINDKYSHLRKALIEGKIIQIWEVTEQHDSDSSKDIYGWKDFKSFKPHSPFGGEIHNYRIKPKESEFKVGDFVMNKSINLVKQYSLSDLEYDKTATNINNWIKWKPSHKELCWFTTRAAMLDGVNYAVLGYFNTIIGLDYTTTHGDTFRHCEPFINSKPSWFK